MPGKTVSIDLETAMSPFAMASILSGKRSGAIETIYVPSGFRFIEVWAKNGPPPTTLRLLDHNSEEIEGAARFFDHSLDNVNSDNAFAGLYLLSRAWREGMVKELETSKMTSKIAAEFNDKKVFPDFYKRVSPSGLEITINPDLAGDTLEGLVGHAIESNIEPIFGDVEFLMHISKRAAELKLGTLVGQVPRDPNVALIQQIPTTITSEVLYKLCADNSFARLLPHMAVPFKHENEGQSLAIELGAVFVDHATHSVYAGVGQICYKLWRAFLRR